MGAASVPETSAIVGKARRVSEKFRESFILNASEYVNIFSRDAGILLLLVYRRRDNLLDMDFRFFIPFSMTNLRNFHVCCEAIPFHIENDVLACKTLVSVFMQACLF